MDVLRVEGLAKNFTGTLVLNGVNVVVPPGEMLFVLGPSGAGKTTFLRTLAGLVPLDAGKIFVNGTDVSSLPPQQRGISAVWQGNALWPHMNVRENIAFGLEQLRLPAEDIRQIVHETMSAVLLDSAGDRKPGELSGGQQQRAALARALAVKPQLLLLDEPFSHLETRLREKLFSLLRQHCRETGMAIICVTQNQRDALSQADRIGVFAAGTFQQIAVPLEIYRRPGTRFVAEFLGLANVLPGEVINVGAGEFIATTALGEVRGSLSDPENEPLPGSAIDVIIRREALHIDLMAPEENVFFGEVDETAYFGDSAAVVFQTANGTTLRIAELNPCNSARVGGRQLCAWVAPEDVLGINRR